MFTVSLLCLQAPITSSDWKPVEISPSTILYFPPGGGTCMTYLKLPRDGLVDDLKFNFKGKPVYTNSSFMADADQLWNGSMERMNVSLGPDGIGLGEYGSWWEETAVETWQRALQEDREGWQKAEENGSVMDNWTYDEDAGGLRLARELEKAFVADAATVGLWHFDDATGTAVNDSSGLGNDGVLFDSSKWTKGRFGGGLLFDGEDDYVKVSDANSLTCPKNLTVECWVNSYVEDTLYRPLVTKYNGQNSASEYNLYMQDGRINGQIISATSYAHLYGGQSSSRGWYYLAMTYDGATVKLYLNGEAVASAAFNQPTANTLTPVIFGKAADGQSVKAFYGILDEIRISNIARPISNAFVSNAATLISPVLNVSAYSRVMVQGDFPDGTNYTVDILDPNANNATLQEGLQNDDILSISCWAGLENPYRDIALRLNINTTDLHKTLVLRKWGVGTGQIKAQNISLLPDISKWSKEARNPVLVPGGSLNWDWANINSPTVVKAGSKYYIWYSGSGDLSAIGLATSEDGVSWTKSSSNPVLSTGSVGSWDGQQVYEPAVFYDGQVFHMFYSGYDGVKAQIGYAKSPDGISWIKEPGNPVLTVGITGSWDARHAYDPSLIIMNGTFYMWYSGVNAQDIIQTGLATSIDGITWNKDPNNPVLTTGATGSWDQYTSFGPTVIYNDGIFHMWYIGTDGKSAYIGYASSSDGKSWAKYLGNPVITASQAGWDSGYVYGPAVIFEGGHYCLWYSGSDRNQYGIGMAACHFLRSHSVGSEATPFHDSYGNLFVSSATPPNTGYRVNITDENNITLLSDLRNGDPILVDPADHPVIRINLTLWTNISDKTPFVSEWGYGLGVVEDFHDDPIQAEVSGVDIEDGIRLASGARGWQRMADGPTPIDVHQAVWDTTRQQMIIYGGRIGDGYPVISQTWIYSLANNAWAKKSDGPDARGFHTAVWDDLKDRMLVFGGTAGSSSFNDFWAYYPARDTWVQLPGGPSARHDTVAVWDNIDKAMLLYGGYSMFGDAKNDLWAYYSATDTWKQLANGPSARCTGVAAWDIRDRQMIIFSGFQPSSGGAILNWYTDTWMYNVGTDTWTQKANGPACFYYDTAVWDSIGNRMLVYGGNSNAQQVNPVNHLWSFDPAANIWVQLANGPPARANHRAVWDERHSRMIIYGGYTGANWLKDIWFYQPMFVDNGSLSSPVIQLPTVPSALMVSYKSDTPTNTTSTVSIRSSADTATWSSWVNITSGQRYTSSDFTAWGSYCQYNITMNTTDNTCTPVLADLRIEYRPHLDEGRLSGRAVSMINGEIASARPKLISDIPLGSAIEIYLSADNGFTWQKFDNDTSARFTANGHMLLWRLIFLTDGKTTPSLDVLAIDYCIEDFPSNLSIDIGKDGAVEWRHNGTLNSNQKASNLTQALNAYVQNHRAEADLDGLVTIPLKVSSATGGILVISVEADISPFFPRIIDYTPIGIDIPVNAPITLGFSEQMEAGSLNISISPNITLVPNWDEAKRNFTFTHVNFKDNTAYTILVRAGARSLAGIGMEKDLSWEFTTMLLPRITDYSPTGNEIPLNIPIRLNFNGPMNESSVKVTVDPPMNLISFWFGDHDNLSLAHQDFQPDTAYAVTVAPGAYFTNGVAMAEGIFWEFRTVSRPKVLSFSPSGSNVRLDTPIRVSFSEKMVPGSVSVNIFPKLALNQVWSPDGRNLTLGHDDFPEETLYNITISAGATSSNGARLETAFSWEFTTMLIPRIVAFSPSGVNVPLSSSFSLEFNKPMNLSALVLAIEIDPPTKGGWKAMAGGRIFGFTPASKLQSKTDYSITLYGNVTDLEGNLLGKDSNWAFTTIQASSSVKTEFPWLLVFLVVLTIGIVGTVYVGIRRAGRPKKEAISRPKEAEVAPAVAPLPVAVAATPPEAMPVAESDVSVDTNLNFNPNLVELGMSVTNQMHSRMEKTVLKLVYNENALMLTAIKPGYAVKGDDIQIGTIEPRATLNITAEFKPTALAKSQIEGVIFFKDRQGRLQTVQIPPVAVALERPELHTDTNITTTKMIRRIVEELDYSGARLFAMPPDIRPQQAFELGKAAVQHHDLRLVDQFSEKNPYIGEAWYNGQAKSTQDMLVVRVRFVDAKNVLEFFVLSTSASLLTGMTLSLKEDLIKELIASGNRPNIKEMTDPEAISAVSSMRTLLDKELGMDKNT